MITTKKNISSSVIYPKYLEKNTSSAVYPKYIVNVCQHKLVFPILLSSSYCPIFCTMPSSHQVYNCFERGSVSIKLTLCFSALNNILFLFLSLPLCLCSTSFSSCHLKYCYTSSIFPPQ